MNDLTKRTALVTGGARGIGRACAQRLGSAGAKVIVNYRANRAAADETVQSIVAAGGQARAIAADVADESQVTRLVDESRNHFGPIELLVNNAGIFDYGPHEELDFTAWQRTMAVNLNGVYLVTWAVKDSMIEGGFGRIVNLASIAGLRPRAMAIAYAASKAAVVSFTQSTAEAWARQGIRVNAIAPGLIDTEIISHVADDAKQRLLEATPMPRLGEPDEIAEACHFLLSEKSSFVTGQTLVVDGGRVMLP
jgi:3-oxoacyl-[acyl-carrier protein] reductase